MVDAVITWVDGNDPKHNEKLTKYIKHENNQFLHPKATHPTRYASKNEVWYCVHSIRKFAQFIDTIYLVTDDQRPGWLTRDVEKSLNIKVIDHKTIFKGFENYLPTFNSITIESLIHRIPGLSDKFLYFNDDLCLINRVEEIDYFKSNRLLFRGDWVWRRRIKQRLGGMIKLNRFSEARYIGRGYIGYRNEDKFFKKNRLRLFNLAHAPHPLEVNLCEQVYGNDNNLLEQQIKHKFKSRAQYSLLSLAANIGMAQGVARKGPLDYGYLYSGELSVTEVAEWLSFFDKHSRIKSFCLQSLDQAKPEVESAIISFLEKRIME